MVAPGKQSYPYALAGGGILLVAVAFIGAGFIWPFASLSIEDNDARTEDGVLEYDAQGYTVRAEGGDEQSAKYRDSRLDDQPGAGPLRYGTWALLIGGVLALAAALTLFAAPSSGLGVARAGGATGMIAGLIVASALLAFILGYSDQGHAFTEDLEGGDFQVAESNLLGGTYFMGLGAVLALGGAVLGFSDKRVEATTPSQPIPAPSCGACNTPLAAGQAFCSNCGQPTEDHPMGAAPAPR